MIEPTLLSLIEGEIAAVGGRIKMMSIIMSESAGWFTFAQHAYCNERLSKIMYNERKKRTKERKDPEWLPGDVQYLKDNYKKIPTSEIAKNLGRTSKGVRTKLYRLIKDNEFVLPPIAHKEP